MGQYHTISSPEMGVAFDAHDLGGGVKALEQVWSYGPRLTLGMLLAHGFETHPRDLPWAKLGHWAGRHVLATGDYAENDDLLFHPKITRDEKDLYGVGKDVKLSYATQKRKGLNGNITHNLLPLIENIANVRFNDLGGDGKKLETAGYSFNTMLSVKKGPAGWDWDDEGNQAIRDYCDRVSNKDVYGNIIAKRDPIFVEGAPKTIPSKEDAGAGGKALWVSLDRQEYINPAVFGEDDLMDVLNGKSGMAVLATLFHHDDRGGGDMRDIGPLNIAGRWRGNRLVLMGPNGISKRYAKATQEDVLKNYTDITHLAKALVDAETLFSTEFPKILAPQNTPTFDKEQEVKKAVFKNKNILDLALSGADLKCEIILPGLLSVKETILALPADVKVTHTRGQGSVWIDADTHQKLMELIKTQEPVHFEATQNGIEDATRLCVDLNVTSSHNALELLS